MKTPLLKRLLKRQRYLIFFTLPKKSRDQQGIALLMVMSIVTLMIGVLANFKFETELNKRRVYVQQDKSQAKLNAMAGLNLAMARLDLYKEAQNLLEKSPKRKKDISPQTLDKIYSVPFAYPIPLSEDADARERSLVEDFMNASLLRGELQVVITKASGRINLNLLRLNALKDYDPNRKPSKKSPDELAEGLFKTQEKLIELLTTAIEKKKEKDEEFELRYSDVNPSRLIKTLSYAMNEAQALQTDPEIPEIEAMFQEMEITAKHAPFTSVYEIYLLPGWDDELLALIENEITVHGNMAIDLNKMTANLLGLLLPELDEDQVVEFFKYRDDPDDPHPFNSFEELRRYVLEKNWVEAEELDDREAELRKLGISFGGSTNLFQVFSKGRVNSTEYVINAWVIIPVKPPPPPEDPNPSTDTQGAQGQAAPGPNVPGASPTLDPKAKGKKKKQIRVLQFLAPRVVEIYGD